jgi:16S rRNA (cytosine1402-N4)-methyltransferase
MKPNRRRNNRPKRSTPAGEHRPVLLREVLDVLGPRPGEIAADCTVGLAGHALAILRALAPGGRLIGLDWDQGSLNRAETVLRGTGQSFVLHQANFASLPHVLAREQTNGVDVLIADVGMSSVQVDDPGRGFSYVRDGPLDMRMDTSRGRTAAQILASISEDELVAALIDLADEPNALVIARALIAARDQSPILRTWELARIVGGVLGKPVSRPAGWRLRTDPDRWQPHPAARTFQTLRMLVNRELPNLQELLRVLPHCVRPGGRVAVISFHSGEDRLVKQALRDGFIMGFYDETAVEPVRPSEEEKLANPRSRSAKLRWARRAPVLAKPCPASQ